MEESLQRQDFNVMTNKKNKNARLNEINEEREIVEKILSGDTSIFSEIVDKYQKKIILLVDKFIYDRDEADDVVQEIFIKLYHNLSKFKFDSTLGTYLYRIAINYCIDVKKKKDKIKKRLTLVKNNENELKNIPGNMKSAQEQVENEYLRKQILRLADEKLSEKQKSVFILKYFDDLSLKEISSIMNMSEGTIKSHLSRSYNKLREDLRSLLYE